jgi:HrpA-like RNA helicase
MSLAERVGRELR